MNKMDIAGIATDNIFRYKSRSFICILSVFIGVFAVLLIGITSDVATSIIKESLSDVGIKGISVFKHSDEKEALTDEIVEKIQNDLDFVDEVMPVVTTFGSFASNAGTDSAVIWGVSDNFKATFDVGLLYGRLHNRSDINTNSRNIVVDETLAKNIYKRSDIIDSQVKITIDGITETFNVIGVIKSQKSSFENLLGEKMPSFVYIPYTTVNEIRNIDEISQVAIKPNIPLDQATIKTQEYLNRNPNIKGTISVENLGGYIDGAENILDIISIILILIALISLIVAMLGVMSSMFSAVTERRIEIGIYMALGAKKKDIINIFIYEAIIICIIGAFIAISINSLVYLAVILKTNISLNYNFWLIISVIIICFVCGLISGVMPARAAAKLNPIDALRDV